VKSGEGWEGGGKCDYEESRGMHLCCPVAYEKKGNGRLKRKSLLTSRGDGWRLVTLKVKQNHDRNLLLRSWEVQKTRLMKSNDPARELFAERSRTTHYLKNSSSFNIKGENNEPETNDGASIASSYSAKNQLRKGDL